MPATMLHFGPCILLLLSLRSLRASDAVGCAAAAYAAPGFQSHRGLYLADQMWDGFDKVAFPTENCVWLAGNMRDTGSEAVFILFGGAKDHKETWILPQIAQKLASEHGVSSLAVDNAGRGESCGYEIGPSYSSTVRGQANIPWRYCSATTYTLAQLGLAHAGSRHERSGLFH